MQRETIWNIVWLVALALLVGIVAYNWNAITTRRVVVTVAPLGAEVAIPQDGSKAPASTTGRRWQDVPHGEITTGWEHMRRK